MRRGDRPSSKRSGWRLVRWEFAQRLESPRAFAGEVGAGLGEYLCRALAHRARLAEPRDLAWLLASHARDALARVEAAGDAPSLEAVRAALEEALGVRFEGERGARFFAFDAGADIVLRRVFRLGAVGAANTAVRESVQLARSGLAFAGTRHAGAVPTAIAARSAATAWPRRGVGLDICCARSGGLRRLLCPLSTRARL